VKVKFLSKYFRKIVEYQTSSKYVPWEPNFSTLTDRPTDMKLIVAFRNFVNAPKSISKLGAWEAKYDVLRMLKWMVFCTGLKLMKIQPHEEIQFTALRHRQTLPHDVRTQVII
jgi:hypothetical protein